MQDINMSKMYFFKQCNYFLKINIGMTHKPQTQVLRIVSTGPKSMWNVYLVNLRTMACSAKNIGDCSENKLLRGGGFSIFAGKIWVPPLQRLAESGPPSPSENWQNLGALTLRIGRIWVSPLHIIYVHNFFNYTLHVFYGLI